MRLEEVGVGCWHIDFVALRDEWVEERVGHFGRFDLDGRCCLFDRRSTRMLGTDIAGGRIG